MEILRRTFSVLLLLAVFGSSGAAFASEDSGEEEVSVARAYLAFGKGDVQEARSLLEKAVAAQPSNSRALNFLALTEMKAGDYGSAAAHFRTAIAIDSTLTSLNVQAGLAELFSGNFSRAAEHFTAALVANPEDSFAHYCLGYIAFRRQKMQAARSDFEAARKGPKEIAILASYHLGLMALDQKNNEESEALLGEVRSSAMYPDLAKSATEKLSFLRRASYDRNWNLKVSAGAQFDDNVPLDAGTLRYSNRADERAVFLLSGGYYPVWTGRSAAGVEGSGFFSLHTRLADYNVQDYKVRLVGSHKFEALGGSLGLAGFYQFDISLMNGAQKPGQEGMGVFSRSHTLSTSFLVQEADWGLLAPYFTFSYDGFPATENGLRDALRTAVGAGQNVFLFDRLRLQAGGEVALNAAKGTDKGDAPFRYTRPAGFFDFEISLPAKVSLGGGFLIGLENHSQASDKRKDQIVYWSGSAGWEFMKGARAELFFERRDNRSSISRYRYVRNSVSLSLGYSF